MKKILAVTGIRSEYDILYPVIKKLSDEKDFIIKVVVTGAHLSDWHGFTLKKIEKDGFYIADKIDCLFSTDRTTQRVKGVGILTYALSQTVERENPDFLLVIGDREESIATALVANYMNILVAHIGGGDPVYGNADDPIRFAVSKLAHIHFVMAEEYRKNLINIGEDEFRVFNVGNPSLDNIRKEPGKNIDILSKEIEFDISDGEYIFFIEHPLSSEKKEAYHQMEVSLQALKNFALKNDYKIVASYPNTDPGSYDLIKVIKNYENEKFIKFFKTLPRNLFINLLRNAKALVGNSSMGLLEAPFYKLPVVNIGNRQLGRLNAGNVVFVEHDEQKIISEIEKACFNNTYRDTISKLKNPYGDGFTSEKIVDIISQIDPKDNKWLVKRSLC